VFVIMSSKGSRVFHGGDYEECRHLGYKNSVRTSQETHVSATEPIQCYVRFEVFTAVTMKNAAVRTDVSEERIASVVWLEHSRMDRDARANKKCLVLSLTFFFGR
jgi:hypothetical protein